MDKIVVAIHGIGNQLRSDTVRAVARNFGSRSRPPLPVMPLGFFQIGKAGEVHVSRLEAGDGDPLSRIGFAEVYWADIPRTVVKADDTLEESKAWGSSIVSRARAAYVNKVTKDKGKNSRPLLNAEDFGLAAGVIDEIVEGIDVMENLLVVAEKAGIFKFDLGPLLRDYVGDVQIVTEFKYYREQIVYRFHSAMTQIVQRFQQAYPGTTPDIHIVAHSEGTVISFLGMLQALSSQNICDPDTPNAPISTDWIQYVRGFMTIGSPIDKHLVLWPNLWAELQLKSAESETGEVVFQGNDGKERLKLKKRIKWRNYYDFGDPIGFRLDTAVEYLESKKECEAFEFDKTHDFGFSRYWLPGKAHNDYWTDTEVFGHFIDDVVLPGDPPRPPKNRPVRGIISTAIPYVLSFVLHFGAVFLLYKAVTDFLADSDSSNSPMLLHVAKTTGVLSLLLMSITAAARLPRLVKTTGLRWHVVATLLFAVGALVCWEFLPLEVADFLGRPFQFLVSMLHVEDGRVGVVALLLVSAIVAASGWVVPRKPRWARRFLIGFGCAVVSFIVGTGLLQTEIQAPVWPVVLAGLAFLYLWWLGILLFDLAFIWHRYIRQSVAVDTLSEWNRGKDAQPKPLPGQENAQRLLNAVAQKIRPRTRTQ